ncbi:MAG: hypothetical protein H6811_06325 [Phycisphaeraceae bacterium]|nr:hypothetical protein [Phycisphaeraceae bacterium]
MKRAARLTPALLVLGLGACSTFEPQARVDEYDYEANYRLNVGAGDMLGATTFGVAVTLAKAEQFGDMDFASVTDDER